MADGDDNLRMLVRSIICCLVVAPPDWEWRNPESHIFLGMTKQKYLKPPTSLFLMKVMMYDPYMFNRG